MHETKSTARPLEIVVVSCVPVRACPGAVSCPSARGLDVTAHLLAESHIESIGELDIDVVALHLSICTRVMRSLRHCHILLMDVMNSETASSRRRICIKEHEFNNVAKQTSNHIAESTCKQYSAKSLDRRKSTLRISMDA